LLKKSPPQGGLFYANISGCFCEIKPGRLIPTISNPAVAEGMLQNLPMVVDFAHKYVGDKNAFGFAKGLVKFANKVISESNKTITNAGNGTREVSLPGEAAVPQVDTDTGMGYNGNEEDVLLDQAVGMEKPYTPKQIEEFAKANGVTNFPFSTFEWIYEFSSKRQDLAENLIKAIPESYGDEGLSIVERVEKYQLPENPSEQSLSTYQTRIWYKWQESLIESRLDYSKPLEEVAKQAFEMRNKIRTQARMSMSDTQWAQHLLENEKNKKFVKLVEKYQDVGYTGEDLWKEIIAASMRSRDSVDDLFGLNK
jgi:hypothetical protein